MCSLWKRIPGDVFLDKQPGCYCFLNAKQLSGAFSKGGNSCKCPAVLAFPVTCNSKPVPSGSAACIQMWTLIPLVPQRWDPGPSNNPGSNISGC